MFNIQHPGLRRTPHSWSSEDSCETSLSQRPDGLDMGHEAEVSLQRPQMVQRCHHCGQQKQKRLENVRC